jgi:hypothetical protein
LLWLLWLARQTGFQSTAVQAIRVNIATVVKTRVIDSWRILQLPVFDSNFLSHTAHFSAGRKIWNQICLLKICEHSNKDHRQSLLQSADVFYLDGTSFILPQHPIPLPCRLCMSLCTRVACTRQRQLARGLCIVCLLVRLLV